jgi:hypothetical protein
MHAHRQLLQCRGCGVSWLESGARDVTDVVADVELPPDALLDDPAIDDDVLAIARAARQAAERHAAATRRRRAELRGWSLLALVIAVPIALLMLFPDRLGALLPGAARLYLAVGLDTSMANFLIRGVEQTHTIADGTRVLAVRGEVVNAARSDHRVPALLFRLKDANGHEVYAWTLKGALTRALKPGEATGFITRLASPPLNARELEISFAHTAEIAVNPRP